MSSILPIAPSANQDDEQLLRRDLAACYRLVAHMGWDDLIATHISVRLPGPEEAFLINPFGMLFEEVTASSLVKINSEGEILAPTPYKVNPAGFVIHSAIHMARPDARCVLHLHTKDGVAVSMLEEGLLALNQTAMLVAGDIAYHAYEGTAVRLDERARLQADLGRSNLMILRHHGTLAVGGSVAEAFVRMYLLEWACSTQVRALSMGRALASPEESVIEEMRLRSDAVLEKASRELYWPALLRKVERLDPGFDD